MGIFDKLKQSLTKTRDAVNGRIDEVLKAFVKVDEELLDELEEALISADVGVNTAADIIDRLRAQVRDGRLSEASSVKSELKRIIGEMLTRGGDRLDLSGKPTVVMVIGVNGVGKTTSIGKMAHKYAKAGKKVIIAAADTFRAAAIEQLDAWAERAGVDIIKSREGADPSAVIFDAVAAAKARGADLLICDTAGRLHNKKNLMEELRKMRRIIDRELTDGGKEVLLVLDATTGQNAVSQAEKFREAADISGIILTKLDGTAKGGIVLAIKNDFGILVKLVGVGEGIDDLEEFDAAAFADAIVAD